MYGKAGSTDGNKLTVAIVATGKKIEKIKINFDSANDGACAKIFAADGTEIKANADGTYTINATSFYIVDDNTGKTSNTQVRFQSIKIYTKDAE